MTTHRTDREHGFWHKFAGGYDTFMRLWRPTYGEIVNQVLPWLREDAAVLEVAAGTGLITLQVAPHVARVGAIDISPAMLDVAARKAAAQGIDNVNFAVQDAYHLESGDQSFDIGRARYVRPDETRLAALLHNQPRRPFAAFGVHVGDDDPGAFPGEGQRSRPADARPAAGDDSYFILEPVCHAELPSR